jgi:hypothetical protein
MSADAKVGAEKFSKQSSGINRLIAEQRKFSLVSLLNISLVQFQGNTSRVTEGS